MKRNILVGVAAAALIVGASAGAQAGTIYLGWNTTGGPAVTLLGSVASPVPGTATSATALGGFTGSNAYRE